MKTRYHEQNDSITQQQQQQHQQQCVHVFEDHLLTPTSRYLQYTILTVCCCFVSFMNILLAIGLKKTNKKLNISKKLFLYLSCTDLFTGIVAVPYQMAMVGLASNASCFMVSVQAFLNCLTPAVGTFTILSISVARYISVIKPSSFRKHARSRMVFVLMIVQYLIAFVCAIWYATAKSPIQLGSFLITVTLVIFGVIGVSLILNVCLYYQLIRNATESIARKNMKNRKYQKEVAQTLIIISLILSLCYLPNGIVFGLVGYYVLINDASQTYNSYIPWVYLLMVLNAGLNSFVYMWRDKDIVNYYLQKIQKYKIDKVRPARNDSII